MKIVEKPQLPKEVFEVEVKPQLLAQAVRVYLANQRQGTQSAQTRAEVNRTRKKLYKQKGTGGARHGDRKAPIFVCGGVAFPPKPRSFALDFPKNMRQKALFGALSEANKAGKVVIVAGMDKLTGKTQELAEFTQPQCLVVTDSYRQNVWQAGRNIEGVTISPFSQLNTYAVIKAKKILFMEEIFAKKETPEIKKVKKAVKKKA
jgi:large subunit ribosomal protein L4